MLSQVITKMERRGRRSSSLSDAENPISIKTPNKRRINVSLVDIEEHEDPCFDINPESSCKV